MQYLAVVAVDIDNIARDLLIRHVCVVPSGANDEDEGQRGAHREEAEGGERREQEAGAAAAGGPRAGGGPAASAD